MGKHIEIHADIERTQRHTLRVRIEICDVSGTGPAFSLLMPLSHGRGKKLFLFFCGNLLTAMNYSGWYEVVEQREDYHSGSRTICLKPTSAPSTLEEWPQSVFVVPAQ